MILKLPSLTTPLPKEILYVYLATSNEAVNAVLMAYRKGKQCPVHYVSRTLHDAERNYAPLEKVALALLHDVSVKVNEGSTSGNTIKDESFGIEQNEPVDPKDGNSLNLVVVVNNVGDNGFSN
ncbi:reverse transcriptase domain-containing protein [Tanacetum coccineum]